jgi:hypothetical protein
MGTTCRSQIGIVKSSLKWSWCYSLENNKVILFSVTILYCYFYDASCTNFISYTPRMARTNPSRTVQVRDVTLDEYDGNLADTLRGILQECGCETRIPVKKYAYYEGRVF